MRDIIMLRYFELDGSSSLRGVITAVPHRLASWNEGLTQDETMVLDLVVAEREPTEKRLRELAQLDSAALTDALARLLALGYIEKAGRRKWRPAKRA